METECRQKSWSFPACGGRNVVARFDGGRVTSDGSGILLKEVDDRFRFLERFAACFTDHRDPELIEHPLVDLLKQRVFGLCLGYEDLIDTTRCGTTRCWPSSSARPIRRERRAAAAIRGRGWRARAR
jgi:hypothetical protein